MADERRHNADQDRTRRIPTSGAVPPDARTRPAPRAGSRVPDAPPGVGVRSPAAAQPRPRRNRPQTSPADGSGGGSGGGGGRGRPAAGAPGPSARRRRGPRLRTIVVLVVLAVLIYPAALVAVAWTRLGRVDALPADTASTPGRTYLVVGSDSRKGLSKELAKKLHTGGGDVGQRTDTIMLLHVPAGRGPTVLLSVPRDSYVAIPGHGRNKINAAFAYGGPQLLAQTLEQATGVQIDDYVEIGFAGFAAMVEAVGGVQICPERAMKDKDAGLNIKKGCQQADGPVALGYARARHSDPRGDLGRVDRQREVLAAIVSTAMRPGALVNPFRTFPLASSGAGSLTVDEHTGPVALLRFVLGMKGVSGGKGLSLTVPVAGTGRRSGAGSVVLWDEAKAQDVFGALRRSDTGRIRVIADQQAALLKR